MDAPWTDPPNSAQLVKHPRGDRRPREVGEWVQKKCNFAGPASDGGGGEDRRAARPLDRRPRTTGRKASAGVGKRPVPPAAWVSSQRPGFPAYDPQPPSMPAAGEFRPPQVTFFGGSPPAARTAPWRGLPPSAKSPAAARVHPGAALWSVGRKYPAPACCAPGCLLKQE